MKYESNASEKIINICVPLINNVPLIHFMVFITEKVKIKALST